MFLNLLETQEKNAFMELAIQLVKADNKTDSREEAMLRHYLHEMNIGEDEFVFKEIKLDQLVPVFKSRRSKRAVLMELLALALADNDFDVNEQNLVAEISGKFGFEADELKQMTDWVIRIQRIYAEGYQLLEA